jgi:RNA-directed DNA polymerase
LIRFIVSGTPNSLAKTLWKKIQDRTYDVEPAVLAKIPKGTNDFRNVMVFPVPDTAIANLFNRRLRDRNRNLQSPFNYSYRKDRTIFDAVLQTSAMLKGEKTYVVQYDFSKYFDSIKHEYINFLLDKEDFSISPTEKWLVNKFICHRFSVQKEYKKRYVANTFERSTLGVPQGCSLSLFLSNIAAHELDKALEKADGSFVRFADDTVCVASSYKSASAIESAFRDHCYFTGISINLKKSPGIAFLKSEIPNGDREYFFDDGDLGKTQIISDFDFIGHKFTRKNIQMSERAVSRIKKRIAKIVYIHLLHNPKRDLFNKNRVGAGFYDWDLVTCMNELRNYMYGGLKESQIKSFVEANVRISRFKGLMSFYPLVTCVDQFAMLDGWLLSILRRAVKERTKLLFAKFGTSLNPLSERELLTGEWYAFGGGIVLETNAPSFVSAWRAARKAFKQYGLADFEAPGYYSALFDSY